MINLCKLIFVLCLSTSCFMVSGQDIIVSNDINVKGSKSYGIIGNINDQYLFYRDKFSDNYIDVFDNNLKIKDSWELLWYIRYPKILGFTEHDSLFNVLFNYKSEGKKFFRVDKYDSFGNMSDSLLVEHDFPHRNEFKFTTSLDESYCCFYTIDSNNEMLIGVFNTITLELVWKDVFSFDIPLKKSFLGLVVSNSGKVGFLADVRSRIFSGKRNKFSLYVMDNLKFDECKFYYDDNKISSFNIDFVNDEDISLVGLYGDDDNKIKGIVSFEKRVSYLSKEEKLDYVPFSESVLKEYYNLNEYDAYIDDLELRKVIRRRDNGIVVIAEIRKEVVRRSNSSMVVNNIGPRRWVDYLFKDILILSYDDKLNMNWNNFLHKNQYAQDDDINYSSFFLFYTQHVLKFYFNDDINSNVTVTEYLLDPKGKKKRSTFLNIRDKDLQFRFSNALQISHNQFLVPSQVDNVLNICRVTF